MELHRGRLIDHIQLVVADLDASRRFYEAVFKVLDIPVESNSPSHFWGDELVHLDRRTALKRRESSPAAITSLSRPRIARRSTASMPRA